MNSLADLRIFSKVIRTGSFSAAARQLGLPPSSVSRRIRSTRMPFTWSSDSSKVASTPASLSAEFSFSARSCACRFEARSLNV